MKRTAAPVLICVMLAPTGAHPFQPLVTDDTETQAAGGNQIEVAYNRTVDGIGGAHRVAREIPIVYTRGITDALELYLGLVHQRLEPPAPSSSERGWGNTALGAKWRFYENEPQKLSLAVKPEVRLPASESREARGLGTARATYAIGLIATQETGFGAIHANVAAERVAYSDAALDAAARHTRRRVSIAPVWDVSEYWKLALDTGWVTNPDPTARPYLGYAELGAVYAPIKDLEIALGIIRNFRDGNVRTTQVTFGLTSRFR